MNREAAPSVALLAPANREPEPCVMEMLGAVRGVSSTRASNRRIVDIAEMDLIPARGMP